MRDGTHQQEETWLEVRMWEGACHTFRTPCWEDQSSQEGAALLHQQADTQGMCGPRSSPSSSSFLSPL
jgi:hypothetical protein